MRGEAAFAVRVRCHVALSGESGSGKDVFVDEMRRLAAGLPVLRVPAGNLPDELVAGLLFGHERGAFTGADRATDGLALAAGGGWLVLNDADNLSPAVQERLLPIVEGREYLALKAERPTQSDVRMVFVTHQPLVELVRLGKVREDLAFRLLDGIAVELRPLGEHREDIPALASGLLARISAELRVETPRLCDKAMAHLRRLDYPANVRGLGTVLRQALFAVMRRGETPEVLRVGDFAAPGEESLRERRRSLPRRDVSAEMIQTAYQEADTADRAAELLGIETRSLYRRMKELGIVRPKGPTA